MEDRSTIRETHGVANARRISVVSVANSDTQAVIVTDGLGAEVIISLSAGDYPAGMTPEQARMLAEQLKAAAKRADQRMP
jgi:hypothetical protein